MIRPAPGNPMVGFGAAALILTAVGALVIVTALRFVNDSRWAAHTSAALTQVDSIATLERAAIAAQRGYLLTGSAGMRATFWETKAAMPGELAELHALVQFKPAAAKLKLLEPKMVARLDIAARTIGVYEKQGLRAAQAFIQSNGGLQLEAQIQVLLDDVRSNEIRLLRQRRDASERSAGRLIAAAVGGIPLSLLMLGVVYRVLVRENAERRRSELSAQASEQGQLKLSRDLAALSRYAGMLQSCESGEELLAITQRSLSALLPQLAGTLYLLRASRDHAESVVSWGEHRVPTLTLPLPSDCWAVRRNLAYTCDDVQAGIVCAHVAPLADGVTGATACLPIAAQGQLMGWLYLSGAGPGPLPDIAVAEQAAEQFSLALANFRLQEDLRHQSIRDPLTGLYNRRYLEESLSREISRCQRRKLPLVVMMLDLDAFKSFNDRHGHPGGDALLSAFGRLLQSHCRPEDIACRFGGEEFTLILPEADAVIGNERARAILAATAQMVVSHHGVSLGRVTTSIGLSFLPDDGSTGTELLEAADKALYRAKAEGRNRVVSAEIPA